MIGQNTFEPPPTTSPLGIAFYLAAFGLLGWAIWLGEWNLEALKTTSEGTDSIIPQEGFELLLRGGAFILGILFSIGGFVLFSGNLFTPLNVSVWIVAILFIVAAFWKNKDGQFSLFGKLSRLINFNSWTILLIAATVLVFFFRFYQSFLLQDCRFHFQLY